MWNVESSFLSGANAVYIAEIYGRYLENPDAVDPSWKAFFRELTSGAVETTRDLEADLKGPGWKPRGNRVIGAPDPDQQSPKKGAPAKGGPAPASAAPASAAPSGDPCECADGPRQETLDSIRALMLIRAYRATGHLKARTDPLNLSRPEDHPELLYTTYGFTDADLDREIFIDNVLGLEHAPLRQIIDVLEDTYCNTVGVEFLHIQDPAQKSWIQRRIEGERNHTLFTAEGKTAILERLTHAEGFEKFLQVKYTGTKRFGLEGGESLIPALEQILKRGSQLGVRDFNVGMAHRGRLNVLTTIMHKPYRAIFSEFQGNSATPDEMQGSGDVKYHLGTSAIREFDGISVAMSLQSNPSHLEAADPVVLGKVRAKQTQISDTERRKVVGVLIHGDAAFAGQGIVAECFALSRLKGYRTGGTVHFVINNQIGFTTSPQYSRSGQYCTDIAKMIQAPIFHVNGDDPEAVVHVSRIAIEFQQEFGVDVVVDMVCYRRQGHNESDEPAFTQPLMYKAIREHETTRTLYASQLVREGVITPLDADAMEKAFSDHLEEEFKASQTYRPNKADWLMGRWEGLEALTGEEEFRQDPTRVGADVLRTVGRAISTPPKDFDVNPKILRQLKAKGQMMTTGEGIDWATAEALAFGTLLVEGTPVRLSGQDSGRGTFSQRHAVLVDQTNENRYIPLEHISEGQARFEVIDSPLSEFSVLGFEYGYSLAEPRGLVMWEAQFGDFANGAQVIFDQFVSSAESKWLRMSGLVMLLPHGFEGQGPEHSSARPERFLQLCAENNMQVCNITTPANYFHALRRQIRRNFRKPLVVFSPKSLLRHKLAVSPLSEFTESGFHRVIGETDPAIADNADARRVVLCSGKIYYDLLAAREEQGIKDVVLIRVEQLYPWPKDTLMTQLRRYPKAEIVWAQEEPGNMGAWPFAVRRIEYLLDELGCRHQRRALYAGRVPAASPATGLFKKHLVEQAQVIDQALNWNRDLLPQPFRRPPTNPGPQTGIPL
ncbi:2-oxoglutarate dehydrogenase E1 component [Phaeovibrio sulfidiphilus]|uniref:2-oxoglutarate dehydrogenase E1 component n=1 Tax=Phaeovibrio sulfidiphilus TaxID=1220600 RepID=A0A8J7CDG7_9PROT|nr:2-oxoglutarate dehydrogenase E1 component [Phaeovibrio sulfidiphilus]MBE1237728.1 2-oxoglutarate dehydrogenase E1 component [Phaeovibrio sulfidiphilus]